MPLLHGPEPAGGRAGDDAVATLQAHRHLRGPYVFCEPDGKRDAVRLLDGPAAGEMRETVSGQ